MSRGCFLSNVRSWLPLAISGLVGDWSGRVYLYERVLGPLRFPLGHCPGDCVPIVSPSVVHLAGWLAAWRGRRDLSGVVGWSIDFDRLLRLTIQEEILIHEPEDLSIKVGCAGGGGPLPQQPFRPLVVGDGSSSSLLCRVVIAAAAAAAVVACPMQLVV